MRSIIGFLLALILGSCAGLPALDPPRVTLADIDTVSIEGLELRTNSTLAQTPSRT